MLIFFSFKNIDITCKHKAFKKSELNLFFWKISTFYKYLILASILISFIKLPERT